jgi:NADPH2 dehydrogenase
VAVLFEPFTIREVRFRNRIMMSPMIQVSSGTDGLANDWHLVHYGARAVGGVGLVMLEATPVESRGRITDKDLGIWDDRHVEGLARIANFCKSQGAAIGIQLAHAGRKAWSRDGGVGPEQAVGPSAIPFESHWPLPTELSTSDIADIVRAFANGAERAKQAGFDVVELHGAHGYLINQFLSPLSNQRSDQYGGSFENRLLFPREVVTAVREVWPDGPLFLRVSATDYARGGVDIGDMVEIARALRECGVDLIDCSSGGTTPEQPRTWPGYQISYADRIRRDAAIPTAAVGLITNPELAEEVVANGRADMIALGRELLRNPYWPLQAARLLRVDLAWPKPYERAK